MTRLAKNLQKRAPKPIVRTFVFDSGNQAGSRLEIKLEYAAPNVVSDGVEREKKRVLGAARFNRLEDQEDQARDLEEIMTSVLAERVRSIKAVGGDPVKVRNLSELIALSAEDISDFGGLDAELDFDCENTTQLTNEEKASLGKDGEKAETKGDVARLNVKWLLQQSRRVYEWVGQVASDVSYFQDKEWEASLKNSSAAA